MVSSTLKQQNYKNNKGEERINRMLTRSVIILMIDCDWTVFLNSGVNPNIIFKEMITFLVGIAP